MAFKKARRIMIVSGLSALVIACIGLMMPDGSGALKICAAVSVMLLAAAAIIYFTRGKCPHCKKDLGTNIFFAKECPHCKKKLDEENHP